MEATDIRRARGVGVGVGDVKVVLVDGGVDRASKIVFVEVVGRLI